MGDLRRAGDTAEATVGGDEYDEWKIEASPEDVAVCLGGKDEPIVLGYYNVPFQVNVVCEEEC